MELIAETKVVVKVCDHHHGDYEDKEFDYVLGDEVDDYEDLDYEGLEDEL